MSFLSSLLGSKTKSVLGIDVGSSSIKVVQMQKQGGAAVLETYGELALGPYAGLEVGQATNLTADRIGENLKDLMREASVTTTDAGVSIPFSRSLMTLVELPRAKTPEEQKTIVELEARKYIPVPVSEVQLDWFVVPQPDTEGKEPSPKVKVLIVAVHNDELTLLQQIVTANGLAASFYEIEIFSTIRSVVDEPLKPVMIIDIGASATKIYVVEHGVIALSHMIPQGGQDVTRTIAVSHQLAVSRAEELKKEYGFHPQQGTYSLETIVLQYSQLFEEAKRTSERYEREYGKPISQIVLTGGGGVTKDLVTFAQQQFSIPVQVADPFAKTQAPAFMRPVLKEIGPEFAVAVGLALRKLEE